MKLTETILHKAALYPVVAFDVFEIGRAHV